jgi:ABC-2 type transport system permease protein
MNGFGGSGALARLVLRRSRLMLAAWLALFVVFAAYSAKATVDLYPSLASRIGAADAINSSQALVAVYGRVYDPSSLGALAMIKTGSLGAVFVAILSIVLVVRHTRADEESGRAELVGGTAVGRRAPLAAALAVALGANLVLAALTAAGLAAAGLPAAGSVAFGLAWAGVGLAFAAVAAVAAQLTTSARTATAVSAAVLAIVYLLRAVGDASAGTGLRWLTWLSPIGWAQQFRPYAGDRWWVLAVTLGFAVLVGGAAFVLAARRDLGGGLVADRSGPAGASASLHSPLALAWRLHRGALLGWAIGFALVGILIGGLASNVGSFMNNASARDFITKLGGEKGLIDAFLALELAFAGIVASAYGIQVVMRLRAEETGLRADPVLATAVGRVRWALSHIAVALAGTTLLMVLVGAGAGLVRAAQTGAGGEGWRVFGAALVQLPAAWVLAAIVVAAFGLAPRFVAVGWAALAGFVVLGELGPLLKLSHWVMDVSPFAHVPKLPGATFMPIPVVALIAVAVLLAAVGLFGLRRRDIGSA